MEHQYKWPARAVGGWPDDPTAPRTTCAGRGGCGAGFARVARRSDGRRCGRDRCPRCGRRLPIPDELHETYLQWTGLMTQAVRFGVGKGLPEDVARDVAQDAYHEALLRWLPELSRFSTFATTHLRRVVASAAAKRWDRLSRPHETQVDWGDPGHPDKAPAADPDVEEATAADEARGRLEARVAAAALALPPRLVWIVRMRFGFDGAPMTLSEIAAEMGLSKERVRQLEMKALQILERELSDGETDCDGEDVGDDVPRQRPE